MMKYKWMSQITGELQENLWYVIKAIVGDAIHYHFINWKWKYDKAGF